MGQAFFVCSCRSNPIVMHKHGHGTVHGNLHGGKAGFFHLHRTFDGNWTHCEGYFLHRHVFYRCPFLYGGPPLSDSDEDGEAAALLNLGFDIRGSDRQEEPLSDRDSRSDSDRESHVDEEDLVNCSDSYERHSDSDSH